MEGLLTSQQEIKGAIEQLLINFKKDGADRKTAAHIKRRISTLDGYYQEFQSNHIKLCECEERDHEYFTSNYYQKVSDFYQETRAFIMKYLSVEKSFLKPATPLASPGTSAQPSVSNQQQISGTQGTPNPGTSATRPLESPASVPTFKGQGTSSKLEEMLRKQKSNFKALSRTINNINLDSLTEKWELEDLLKTIQTRWSIIDSLHWEIDSELLEENEEYEEAFSSYELMYNNIKKSINSKMWSQNHREKSTPVMDIPIFTGNFHQWTSFKDLFVEAIHSNRSLSQAQKMQFLKSKVKGEAEQLIQHLRITSDNYEVSWEILNHRFNNQKLIFNSHIHILLNLPTLQHQTAAGIKRLHDTTNECLNAIKNLGVDISSWDPLIVFLLQQKLDFCTHNDYNESLKKPKDLPSLQEFLEFLEIKFTSLESTRRKQDVPKIAHQEASTFTKKPHFNKSFNAYKNQTTSYHSNSKKFHHNKCPVCNNQHGIFQCNTFLQFQPDMKQRTINKLSLCKNCLYNHKGNECFSTKRCQQCHGDHNTLLHDVFCTAPGASTSGAILHSATKTPKQHNNNTNVLQNNTGEILLATAKIRVQAADGSYLTLRALIDQGSQASLISENAAQRLALPRKYCKGVIYGVGAKENSCRGLVTINIASLYDQEYTLSTDVFIMKNLVNNLPNKTFAKPSWPYINNLQLADSEYYISRSIDVLLGASVYSSIIQEGVVKDSDYMPVAQQTRLGWILCGNIQSFQCNMVKINMEDIQKFWAIEDITEDINTSAEDYRCEQLYESTTTRQPDGRYIVRLPMHPDAVEKLGSSKHKAVAQFYQLERKFKRQEEVANNYKSFMSEYIKLGHMYQINGNSPLGYYMPHHCVLRSDSSTSSLRVVFNASQTTTSGVSLNDVMYRGPNLQKDLLSLVLNWRTYKFAFTADIEKMFRQIMVHSEDQRFQKIIWRESPTESLQEYQLATVTYGTKSAPYLAMKTLRQLASDERHRFPLAAKVLEQQFYMDDLLSGSHDISSGKQLQTDLILLLKCGGFNLRKWSSNEPQLLENLSKSQDHQDSFDFRHQDSTKALGLTWNAKEDTFTFQCKMSQQSASRPNKWTLLAEISKVFDPLGWLAPVIVQLKLLFQNVWLANINWDDDVPDNIYSEWLILRSDIENINQISIPRWIGTGDQECIELHGFCDASTKAYACVVYVRIQQQHKVSVNLLAAKTKLVPVSKTQKSTAEISLPRLELSGAHLLSKLMSTVANSLSPHKVISYGWCDSTAVLGWLRGEPTRWKPFVANRVEKIRETMDSSCWHYVKSSENPADCASRGVTVKQLKEHTLWWNGPSWLSTSEYEKHLKPVVYNTGLESRKIKQTNTIIKGDTNSSILDDLINKHSSFTRATRVLAWILRALSRTPNKPSYLTAHELQQAKHKIIKHVQSAEFSEDIMDLQNHSKLKSTSKLLNLSPFIDSNGLLRVGGRLRNSQISEDMKHPLIIPHTGHVTNLLIDQAHKSTFHGGARITMSRLRQQYWIIRGNRAVKKRLRLCVLCRKHNPIKNHQLMGDLPEARTNPTRPFYHTGVDFTGYVDVKASKGRGIKTSKGYVAVFVCMVTKAVHLELVSDLSSSAFLMALRRLSARRGSPRHMYSDNGTNFLGASKKLSNEFINLKSILSAEFYTEISEMQIEWHFNAPSWPSAGGLWEAAVKSLKYHLRRVVGEQKLTYEEFSSILSELEACLNSRPLCALTEDPNDIDYLTPSHFLASGPLLTIIPTERDERTRWQLTQKISDDIWRRWRTEYLSTLSARSKWKQSKENININDVVIIHDVNLPPGKWALGRIIDLHPGKDGHVRVVSVRTKGGVLKRPIIKLSVLPVHPE